MASPLRIEYAGPLHHVMSRSNERRPIVRDDDDRRRRLDWLARTVETPHANLSAGVRQRNGSYTSSFNLRHRRAGHLCGVTRAVARIGARLDRHQRTVRKLERELG